MSAGALSGAAAAGIIWSLVSIPKVPAETPSLTPEGEHPLTKREIEDIIRSALSNVKPPSPPPKVATGSRPINQSDSLAERLHRQSEITLVSTALELKKFTVQAMANTSGASLVSQDPIRNMEVLESGGYVPRNWADAYKRFFNLEAQLISSPDTNDMALSSLNTWGLETLQALQSIPFSFHTVLASDLELFGDSEGRVALPCVGVMLKEDQPATGRVVNARSVLPTMKRGYYKVGALVSWEWDLHRSWPTAWYRDPTSNSLTKAFDGGVSFSGRDMNELFARIK